MKAIDAQLQRDIDGLRQFLGCDTPQRWVEQALEQLPLLLVDHANCEKKAASTALNLLYRYTDHGALLHKLSRLAREELRHFEQVVRLMERRGISYQHIGPSRYASGLRAEVASHEPARLVDTLIVGAFIEARSCERFAALVPHLDEELAGFYRSLLRSEARHFNDYLSLAEAFSDAPLDERIASFRLCENALVNDPDTELRFHSGPLQA